MTSIAVPSSDIDCAVGSHGVPHQAERLESSFGATWIVVCEGVGLLRIPLARRTRQSASGRALTATFSATVPRSCQAPIDCDRIVP